MKDIDHLEIAARRISAREPVSDTYLFGKWSDIMVRKRMISSEALHRYRLGAALAYVDVYGKTRAEAFLTQKFGKLAGSLAAEAVNAAKSCAEADFRPQEMG